MIHVVSNEDDFFDLFKKEPLPVIIYGAGKNLSRYIDKITHVDMICDKSKVGDVKYGMTVQHPQSICEVGKKSYVLITVSDENICKEIIDSLKDIETELYVVQACKNTAFSYDFWNTEKKYSYISSNEKLKVNLVCADATWIFYKFAVKMKEYLEKEDVKVSISSDTRRDVDINHHIPYIAYHPFQNDTLMITHVDNMSKLRMLKKQLKTASVGICMSRETMQNLATYGIDRSKLCYISPAQDNVICPHKYLIGITTKCRDTEDLRKRCSAILDVIEGIDNRYFCFFIMGSGWESIVEKMNDKGFEVDYYNQFDYNLYISKMQQIDYFLYMGFDEGTMGFLDALAAGAGTIVTPQGYHLDTSCEIDYPCRNIREFHDALIDLQNKRKKRVDAVKEWTWENYTKKHLKIWNYILKREPLQRIFEDQHEYNDGIYSLLIEDNRLE